MLLELVENATQTSQEINKIRERGRENRAGNGGVPHQGGVKAYVGKDKHVVVKFLKCPWNSKLFSGKHTR